MRLPDEIKAILRDRSGIPEGWYRATTSAYVESLYDGQFSVSMAIRRLRESGREHCAVKSGVDGRQVEIWAAPNI